MKFNVVRIESTASTNADLAALAHDNPDLGEGYVLVAATQTAGKGRQGRSWTSLKGTGLYFSLLLKPGIAPLRASTLPIVVGYGVAMAVRKLIPESNAKLKWPNDIQIDGRKLCGILCEMHSRGESVDHIIAGVGINVNLDVDDLPPETASIATSLSAVLGRRLDMDDVLARILESIGKAYEAWLIDGFEAIRGGVMSIDALYGQHITVDRGAGPISGTASGIAPDGALLLVRDDGGVESIYSGDAHLRRQC